jgi:hypothetical protein
VLRSDERLRDLDDPLLADTQWLKGDRIAVVEVSRQIDRTDVERARRRAAVFRRGGLDAFGMVIGRDWASEDTEAAVREDGVEWRVGEDASPGYLEF